MAALYWRVKGQGKKAIDCLRQVLHYAPHQMKVSEGEGAPSPCPRADAVAVRLPHAHPVWNWHPEVTEERW